MAQKVITLGWKSLSMIILYTLVVGVVFGYVGYQIGYNHGTQLQETRTLTQANALAKQQADDKSALNRLTSDYDTACYNYQVLYDAYDQLYQKAGAALGMAYISRPDGAKGNENSCYR